MAQAQCHLANARPFGRFARHAMQSQPALTALITQHFDLPPVEPDLLQVERLDGRFLGGESFRESLGPQRLARHRVANLVLGKQAPHELLTEVFKRLGDPAYLNQISTCS
jgi:hypothetical protein